MSTREQLTSVCLKTAAVPDSDQQHTAAASFCGLHLLCLWDTSSVLLCLLLPPLSSSVFSFLLCPPLSSSVLSFLLCPPLSSSVLLLPPLSSSVLLLPPLSSSVLLCPPLSSFLSGWRCLSCLAWHHGQSGEAARLSHLSGDVHQASGHPALPTQPVPQVCQRRLSTRSGSTVTSGGRFRCPSCRHEVVLDRHGVYGLQRNLLVENIIDMYKQGNSSRQVPEVKQEQPMCDDHKEERINIYCVTCSVPTCSLCKVFGAHKDCEVAPLDNIFQTQKAELSDCISMLVGNNERIQAIISQLEETCRAVDENGRRQKSKVCESFDHLFALLEERKGELTLRISCEQEEKLDYIRGLRRKHSEHLENAAKLLETAIQTLDESEMAVFLQATKPLLQKIVESADTSHLDKIQHGYEKMEHFRTNCERQRRALMNVDFIKLDEDEDEDVEVRGSTTGSRVEQPHAAGLTANQEPPLSPVQPAPPPQRPSEAPPTATPQTKSPTPSSSQAPPPMPLPIAGSTPQSDQQNESEDKDGPKHVFSFSWLNQK